ASAAGASVGAGGLADSGSGAAATPGLSQAETARSAVDSGGDAVRDVDGTVGQVEDDVKTPDNVRQRYTGADERAANQTAYQAKAAADDPASAALDTDAGVDAKAARDRTTRQGKTIANTTPDDIEDQTVGSQRDQLRTDRDRIQREANVDRQ